MKQQTFSAVELTPSFNWVAIYKLNNIVAKVPLVCWARGVVREADENNLIIDVGGMEVHGMVVKDGKVVSAELVEGFTDYEPISAEIEIEIGDDDEPEEESGPILS